jgi:photosystem II stability/assembly factor-like uncharacterized protein
MDWRIRTKNNFMKPALSPGNFSRAILAAGLVSVFLLAGGCAPAGQVLIPATQTAIETSSAIPATATAPIIQTPAPSPTAVPTEAPTTTPAPTLTGATQVITPTLTRIDMLDENNGWGLTDQSVLRTANGGKQWMDVTPTGISGTAGPLGFFLDVNSAWVLIPNGQDFNSGLLYRTRDAGKTWSSVKVPFSGGSLQFLDQQQGWVLFASDCGAGSCGGGLYRSSDGGDTWTELLKIDQTSVDNPKGIPLVGDKTGIAFADLTHGWVTGVEPVDNYAYLFATLDGGSAWQHQELDLPQGSKPTQLSIDPPHFFSPEDGLLPVNFYNGDKINKIFYATQDGGVTWTPTTPVGISGVYAFSSMQDIWVWDGVNMLATQDGAKTWTAMTPNVNLSQIIMQMDFVTQDTGWVITMDADGKGQLLQTQDGGKTWAPVN